MKLRRIRIENVRSFLGAAELLFDGDISIVIGPNGGGKTNLLDTLTTVLRRHFLTSWVSVRSPTAEIPDRQQWQANDQVTNISLERHRRGMARDQIVDIELEVTARDLENMAGMQQSARELADLTESKYVGPSLREADSWNLSALRAGQRVNYRVLNNSVEGNPDPGATLYRQYLALYEIDSRIRDELGRAPLSTPMISMPVNRAGSGFQSSVSLASHNEYDHKKTVDAATSRGAGSIVTLAVGRLARKYRLLLETSGTARMDFEADEQIQSLTSVLGSLGYRFELVSVDPMTNQYDVKLEKQGSSFLASVASSGEKELLTYLFAIYGLNVRDALIVVDEPELHLHPRWQTTLLSLFEKLSKDTGNQFVLATHSPVFVSPASIQYVSRVFSKNQQSAIVRLNSNALPEVKHLFSVVNSYNNERMFFADKVVLVEGISDRLVFDRVFRKYGINEGSTQTIEIVSVGGKGFFRPYESLLRAGQVPYAIVADQDYVSDVGPDALKKLFIVDERAIRDDVIKNPKSTDGDALTARIEEAISSKNFDDLAELWQYIKGHRRRLRVDLAEADQKLLDEFIETERTKSLFILSRGTLEDYLPAGYRGKELDKLIRFLDTDFWPELPAFAQVEFELIAESVRRLA